MARWLFGGDLGIPAVVAAIFMPLPSKYVKPDDVLSAILGSSKKVARNQITDLVLKYITSNNLVVATTPLTISADEKLLPLFEGKKSIRVFDLHEYIVSHVESA